jgi:hypothetical protein
MDLPAVVRVHPLNGYAEEMRRREATGPAKFGLLGCQPVALFALCTGASSDSMVLASP